MTEASKKFSWLSEFIAENKTKLLGAIAASVLSGLVYFLEPVKNHIYNLLWPDKVELLVDYDNSRTCSGCEFTLAIKLMQQSNGKVKSGVVRVGLSEALLFRNASQQSVSVPEFSGTVEAYKEAVSIRIKPDFAGTARLEINYKNPTVDITKPLEINIIANNKNEAGPRIEQSDTNRVDLTGIWNINIGADHGSMTIKQDPNSNISGSYNTGEATGSVDGFKDGTTFRVFFYKSDKDKVRKRVEGIFVRNEKDDQYIEIKGCAYGIEKDANVKKDTEGSKLDNCINTKDYVGWRGVTVSTFYASARLQE